MNNYLPPGVTTSMIPGNRPEDILYEHIFEKLPVSIQEEIESNSVRGKKLDLHFQKMLDKIFTEDDLLQEMKIIDSVETIYM